MTERVGNRASHYLERIFGFKDEAFTEYMLPYTEHSMRPQELYDLYRAMRDSSEPVVRMAAGWAVLELGLKKYAFSSHSQRYQAIDEAAYLWNEATGMLEGSLQTLPANDPRSHVTYELLLRNDFALAHVPAMRAAAQTIDIGDRDQSLLDATHQNLRAMAEWLTPQFEPQTVSRTDPRFPPKLYELAYRLICNLLFYRLADPRYIALPAGLRFDYTLLGLQSNVMLHTFFNFHASGAYCAKIPLQIKRFVPIENPRQIAKRRQPSLPVGANPFLCLPKNVSIIPTLHALLSDSRTIPEDTNDCTALADQRQQLDEMTCWLVRYCELFRSEVRYASRTANLVGLSGKRSGGYNEA